MFQATRLRLALWYTTVTAILLLLFAGGFYGYVRQTLVERIDDTLHHVAEVVVRSLVIDPSASPSAQVNLEASFRHNSDAVDDDHIDLEWFSPSGDRLWSTFDLDPQIPLTPNGHEATVRLPEQALPNDPFSDGLLLRQVTEPVRLGSELLGYLRVSHPWFEVTKPTRQLLLDLGIGILLMLAIVAGIGWLLSELAIAPIRQSYERLKQFTADASHELRNPIAMIQTTVQVALSEESEHSPQLQQQQQLRIIERLTRRLGRLVDDLLFLARQDSDQIDRDWEWCPLDEILVEVTEEQQAIAAEKNITLILDFAEPAVAEQATLSGEWCQLQGHRDQLLRLFTNLVSNATQYTPAGGEIRLHLRANQWHGSPSLEVQVQDTGIGISPDSLPQIFERFYRADPARPTTTGSGLGLAIALAIVETHHGQITVDSQVSIGTTFTVKLPILQP
jgi:OmpR-family two-component system manganese-sensing sensor histidine kinase